MPSKSLLDLDVRFLPLATRLIEECKKASIPVVIVTTLRSLKEQEGSVRNGTSWTLKSKHLPQPPDGKSHAIDICPKELLTQKNWAPKHPLWWRIGAIGRRLGMRWGGDWSGVGPSEVGKPRAKWDPGHFEWRGV